MIRRFPCHSKSASGDHSLNAAGLLRKSKVSSGHSVVVFDYVLTRPSRMSTLHSTEQNRKGRRQDIAIDYMGCRLYSRWPNLTDLCLRECLHAGQHRDR